MFGAILKATNSSFQKGRTFCHSIYVKKVMKLLAFIFEQSSYTYMQVRFVNFYILVCFIKGTITNREDPAETPHNE